MEFMNPGNVTVIGEGFRLLTKEEFFGVHPIDTEYWWNGAWLSDCARGSDVSKMDRYRWGPELTFRTRTPLPCGDLLGDLAKLLGSS